MRRPPARLSSIFAALLLVLLVVPETVRAGEYREMTINGATVRVQEGADGKNYIANKGPGPLVLRYPNGNVMCTIPAGGAVMIKGLSNWQLSEDGQSLTGDTAGFDFKGYLASRNTAKFHGSLEIAVSAGTTGGIQFMDYDGTTPLGTVASGKAISTGEYAVTRRKISNENAQGITNSAGWTSVGFSSFFMDIIGNEHESDEDRTLLSLSN